MTANIRRSCLVSALLLLAGTANANAYREHGKPVAIAGSSVKVTPPRDWNELTERPGKHTEIWTLDGDQLNSVTFFVGIGPGETLLRERSKKREPLPKFRANMLLAELPELLEGTYRAAKQIGTFTLTGSKPEHFLGRDGVRFTYDFIDSDDLPRQGEASAAVIDGKLYIAAFEAPRLHFFTRTITDYRALIETARIEP